MNENLIPSPQLAKVIGKKPVTERAAIDAFWKYVKKKKLQQARVVRCDAALKAVTGRDAVTLFEIGPALLRHLSPEGDVGPKVRYPNLALAMCIGAEPGTVERLAEALAGDLEEMRWDRGSGANASPLIPKLEALVEEAGDPYAVEPAQLEALVLANSTAEPV